MDRIRQEVLKFASSGIRPAALRRDGYNFLPYFKGEVKKAPREEIYYFGAGGELNAVRWNDWNPP